MAQYQFELNICNPTALLKSVKDAGLSSASKVDTVGSSVFIDFTDVLTTEQQDTLGSIVDAHELTISKTRKQTEVNDLRLEKLVSGYTDGSDRTWGTLSTDISNLSGVCTLIALGVVTSDQTWRDFSNTNHTMTPAQLVQLAAELAIFVRTCYEVSWYHKGQIDNLTSVEDITSYDITTGWPN